MLRGAPVVLSFILLAGCIGSPSATIDPASVAAGRGVDDLVHDLAELVEARIAVEGGVDLHGTVYLPDVADGVKVPTIMDMGPYYGQILGGETYEDDDAEHPAGKLYEHFLRRGYAIAQVSVRGTGQSEGCFMVGGPQEIADVAAAIEWIAAQEWSDGNVAMTGVSYDGTTPWEGLVSKTPALKAIVPVEGISDFYRYSFFEGVPVGGGAAFNTYYEALVDATYTNQGGLAAWVPTMATHLCPEQVEVYSQPYQTYRDGVHGAYWDERDMTAMLEGTTAAVFVVHGTKDFNVKMDNVQTIWDKLPGPKRMLLGQWEHNIPWSNSYDHEQNWTQYNVTIDQFLDAYVRGDPVALAAEQAAAPVLVQDSANATWELTAWPPVESTPMPYFLDAEGTLANAPAADGEVSMRASPIVELAGNVAPFGPLTSEAIAFESDALAEDMRFFGNPWISLNVSVDRPEGSLEARLYEIDADGEAQLVSLGWQNLATRTSRDEAESVPTGTPMEVTILMEGIAHVFEKGSTIRLVLSPDNDETLTPHLQATTFTISMGGDAGAKLWLPTFAPAEA